MFVEQASGRVSFERLELKDPPLNTDSPFPSPSPDTYNLLSISEFAPFGCLTKWNHTASVLLCLA